MFKKGDYITCDGKGRGTDSGLILELTSDLDYKFADIKCVQGGSSKPTIQRDTLIKSYKVLNGFITFRLATVEELKDAGIVQEPIENAPSSQIQFQSKTCGGTTYLQRMMHRIIELRKYHEKPRLTVMVLKGEMQQEVVNRVKKDVALLRKYTGYSSFITVRKEK